MKIIGDRKKLDVLRVDRADGIVIRNLLVEQSAFNGIDIVETNGFRIQNVVARYNQDYGVLSLHCGPRSVQQDHRLRQRRFRRLPGLEHERM